jgi:hypothetical protein
MLPLAMVYGSSYSAAMPENEMRLIEKPAGLRSTLTPPKKRDLQRAERAIAKGLKSFLEVGMALKEIRDKRLYRQHYRTFEEYCIQRWEMSRPRAYQLCAASEVMEDLSTNVDKRLLPESEAQARPLTWLKETKHRRRAWKTAVAMAALENRPVSARDAEEAVSKLSSSIEVSPVNGVAFNKSSESIRAAYADPPYMNQARRRYDCPEVDQKVLIERLDAFDAWALSLSSTSLAEVLPLCPEGVRVASWVKPYCSFKPGVNPAFAWEPVIFKLGPPRSRQQLTIRDWHSASATRNRGLCGAKPESFCF